MPAGADAEPLLRGRPRAGRRARARARRSFRAAPTHSFAARLAAETGVHIHASLYERADGDDGLGYNTAIIVAPAGELLARDAQAAHPDHGRLPRGPLLPPGPRGRGRLPGGRASRQAHLGLPTCWDQWFPEVARAYSLEGADVLIYPTAIGSEPDHPEFDTQPLWEQVIVGNAIANGVFMVAVNRYRRGGRRCTSTARRSSATPTGAMLVQAPRDEPAVLVADLDLDQRHDWLELFPFLTTRRPDAYARLAERGRRPHERGLRRVRVVAALGGNALIRRGGGADVDDPARERRRGRRRAAADRARARARDHARQRPPGRPARPAGARRTAEVERLPARRARRRVARG